MKRYTEVRNYDDMGDVLDGTRESPTGEYIMVDDLLAWLDAEIAMAEENLEIANANSLMGAHKGLVAVQAMLATYRAVKAHIEG
jgi:hypothetical protein